MVDKDNALSWTFVDDDGRPRQLRCRMNFAPAGDPRRFDGHRPDNLDEIAISRPDVEEAAIDTALEGWEDWALLHAENHGIDRWISLPAIRKQINDAGLGIDHPPNPHHTSG
ncbi:hypothetical protein [Mycobacterium sp. URHB0021]